MKTNPNKSNSTITLQVSPEIYVAIMERLKELGLSFQEYTTRLLLEESLLN